MNCEGGLGDEIMLGINLEGCAARTGLACAFAAAAAPDTPDALCAACTGVADTLEGLLFAFGFTSAYTQAWLLPARVQLKQQGLTRSHLILRSRQLPHDSGTRTRRFFSI